MRTLIWLIGILFVLHSLCLSTCYCPCLLWDLRGGHDTLAGQSGRLLVSFGFSAGQFVHIMGNKLLSGAENSDTAHL
jgi:hypothetical protein